MQYVIVTLLNNRDYYLQEINQIGSNVWISNIDMSMKFGNKGAAEYFAVKKKLKNFLVKEVS